MEFIEDSAGSVFHIVRGENGDAVSWELFCEGGAAVVVFEGCYTGSDFFNVNIVLQHPMSCTYVLRL